MLATSLLPFDDSTGFVTSATRGAWMDIGEHIQGGWYGGKAAAIDWWEEETMKVTILQGVMQRYDSLPRSPVPVLIEQILRQGAVDLDAGRAFELGKDLRPSEWYSPPIGPS